MLAITYNWFLLGNCHEVEESTLVVVIMFYLRDPFVKTSACWTCCCGRWSCYTISDVLWHRAGAESERRQGKLPSTPCTLSSRKLLTLHGRAGEKQLGGKKGWWNVFPDPHRYCAGRSDKALVATLPGNGINSQVWFEHIWDHMSHMSFVF